MLELNKHTLQKAIRQLPTYQPPEAIWNGIEQDLEVAPQNEHLQKQLRQMPQYTPPDLVWQNIERALDSPPLTAHLRTIRRRWQLIAACVLLLLGIGVLWQYAAPSVEQPVADTQISVSYGQETMLLSEVDFSDIATKEADEEVFAIISSVCQRQLPVCKTPEFKELRGALKDLDQARSQLVRHITPFDNDPTHHIQLARIERERSDVLKKMIAMI